jgi:ADP-heptose:LPS heptosyltransferase
MEILIIKTAALGDVLRTTSILKPIIKKYNANIHWLTSKKAYPILKNNPYIHKIILEENIGDLLDEKYNLIISLEENMKLCKIVSKIRTDRIIGVYYELGKCVYTRESESWFGMGLLRPAGLGGLEKANELKKKNKKTYQQHLLKMLNIKSSDNELILNLDKQNYDFAQNFFEKNNLSRGDIIIGINTGGGSTWKYKKMDISLTIRLIMKLKKMNVKLLLLGGKDEEERNKLIIKKTNIIDTGTDNSVLDFAAIVNLCTVVLTSDSLCLHISVALKKKVIVFFGPTSSNEIELYGRGIKILPNMDCICCYNKQCEKKPNCAEKYDVGQIISAFKRMI